MQHKKAIIIGSGIAGIASAIHLRNQGFDTEVYEANNYPGGKITEIHTNGYRFDCGPSLFTMPQLIEDIFQDSEKNILDYFQYTKKEVICNYFYEDGTRFIAFSDVKRFAKEAATIFDTDALSIQKYLQKSKQKYDVTSTLFLEKSLHKLSTYLTLDTIKAIIKIGSLDLTKSLHQLNTQNFTDTRLIQFFDRFATYNGSSPYITPGIMSMIPHLEQYYGTFFPKGGMHSITKSLYQLALDLGIRFYFKTNVDRIIVENKKAKGIVVNDTMIPTDLLVSNMDIIPTYKKLLPDQKAPEKILKQSRSSSALIFYWGIKKKFPELELHNIFFSKNYKEEFKNIFEKKQVFDDPTVYINISSKNEKTDAPEGCENWFVMINVPANEGQDWKHIIKKAKKNILKKISHVLKTDIESLIDTENMLDPISIEKNTQSYQGALYGSSSNNKYAAFLRHPNFSRKIRNLYFCGGSVHPGGGIPLCLLSSKIVSELVTKDFK